MGRPLDIVQKHKNKGEKILHKTMFMVATTQTHAPYILQNKSN
jgi:hypothetical protein